MIRKKIARRALDVKNKYARIGLNRLFHKPLFEEFYNTKINRLEKPLMTISFDLDFHQDVKATPALLELLDSFDIKAAFALIGLHIKKYKKIHKMIPDRGHEIINHTYSHPWNEQINPHNRLDRLNRKQKLNEITRFDDICKEILNCKTIGFRMPHFTVMPPDCMYEILSTCNYVYSSSKFALDTPKRGLPYKTPEGIIEIPVSPCPKHPFCSFDSWHSLHLENTLLRRNHRKDFLELGKKVIDKGILNSTYTSLYFDPMDTAKNKQFAKFLEYAHEKRKNKSLKIMTYKDILEREDIKRKM